MQAVLMAGGKGTRLRPFTAVLPKPLVPIGEISILEMVIRQLSHFNFKDIKISVGHKAELIMAVIGDGSRFGVKVTYQHESSPLGTVGALAQMKDLDDNFLVMNGDICTNLKFNDIYHDHVKSQAIATIGTYARHEKIELGVMDVDESEKHIVGFREKPQFDFLVSMGVNVFNKKIIDLIPKDTFFGFDTLMHRMLADKHKIRSYRFDGLWLDIGRPDDYDKMCIDFQRNPEAYLPSGA